jgi:hypothetical protein
MNESLARLETLHWTTVDPLLAKLDSLSQLAPSTLRNQLSIIWGLAILNSGPTERPIHHSHGIFRARTKDGYFLTSTKDYLKDIKKLALQGLIDAWDVEPIDARDNGPSIGLALCDMGRTHLSIPHTILHWSVLNFVAQDLFLQAVQGVAQDPQRDVDKHMNGLWNVYLNIQDRISNLDRPSRFSAVRIVKYAKLLFSYAE